MATGERPADTQGAEPRRRRRRRQMTLRDVVVAAAAGYISEGHTAFALVWDEKP